MPAAAREEPSGDLSDWKKASQAKSVIVKTVIMFKKLT
jgi:hypothetical protein